MEFKVVADVNNDNYISWEDLYMKGDDLQKLSVIQALPQLLQTDNNATVTRIIPKIQQELPNSSAEFHIVASKIFRNLMEMNIPVNLLKPILQGIESKDPIVSTAWIETILAVIPNLGEVAIKNEVIPSAVAMTQLNKAVYYRIASCKMLGQIAIHSRMSALDVKKNILPLVQSLCQDCFYEVRAAMCLELPKIAQGLGSDNLVKSSLLPGLIELSTDDNMGVRAAAVDAVVLIIPFLNPETVKGTIMPLVKQLCNQSTRERDLTFPVIARVFGKLLNNIQQQTSNTESVWFLNFYKQLSKKGLVITPAEVDIDPGLGVTCRESCAYNLPAVTQFTVTRMPSELPLWYSIFKDLAGDPCYLVRKTVAGCIHAVTRLLGDQNKNIVPDIIKLMRDDSEEVLESLVPNIGTTIELLCISGVLSRENTTQATLEVGRALLKCQVELFKCNNWRRKQTFLQQLEHLPNCMPSDFIHQHFTSVVLKLTNDARARPVRTQAAVTVLTFLRYNLKENHRKWIRENLINILCNSKSCYTRHIFVNMCLRSLDIFSGKYFKEHFFQPLLKLIEDPISTVRLCVVNMSPILKRMLILPLDRALQIKLENALSKMEAIELDKDVISTLKCKLKEMRTPQTSRQDTLAEERRRVDEEDKIQLGKIPQSPRFGQGAISMGRAPEPVGRAPGLQLSRSSTASKTSTTSSSQSISDMSFLGQHFYIDAGVALPERIIRNNTSMEDNVVRIEESMRNLGLNKREINHMTKKIMDDEMVVSTVSVENTNLENMSDEDLKELETSTTNITDDVKANIQKISLSKGLARSKLPTDNVKRRNKRLSCIFATDAVHTVNNNKILKRRSLNIGPQEFSKIPICFKTSRRCDERTNMKRTKSESVQSIYSSCSNSNNLDAKVLSSMADAPATCNKIRDKEEEFMDDGDIVSNNDCCNVDGINRVEVKENVPLGEVVKINVPNKYVKDSIGAKVSNLPVLIRRSQMK